jgi:biotin synthase-like enzyme
VSVCAGGIIGLGEGEKDRVGLIHQVRPSDEDCVECTVLSRLQACWTPMVERCALRRLQVR